MAIAASTAAMSNDGNIHASGSGSKQVTMSAHIDTTTSPHFSSLAAYADRIAAQPERFALRGGDEQISLQGLSVLQDTFSLALKSETRSLPPIGKFLRETLEPDAPVTRGGGGGKKRKRAAAAAAAASEHHNLFAPTPLEELVTDGMGQEQVWQQLEYRGKAIENVLSKILVQVGGEQAGDDDEDDDDEGAHAGADDEVQLKSRHDDDMEDDERELTITSLQSLSDAELRAIGIDPAMRAELLQAAQEDDGDQDFAPNDDDDDDDEERGMYPDGYPGASDFSSDEEEEAKGNAASGSSSKRVYYEPLRTEKEQRRRKRQEEKRELKRIRALQKMRQDAARMAAEAQDSDDEDGDEDESDADDDAESEDDDDGETQRQSKKARSLLDSLDDDPSSSSAGPGSSSRGGFKGPRHKSLDDDFFSIDDFNRQTEETERREIFKEAGADGEDEDDEEVDYFRAIDGDDGDMDMDADEDGAAATSPFGDASEIRYTDFFDPPPRGSGPTNAQRRSKGKGKGSRVGQGAKLAKQERDRLAVEAQDGEDDDGENVQDDFDAIDFGQMQGGGGGDDDEEDESSDSSEDDSSDDDDDDDDDDEVTPTRATKVKFNPQVAIRNIKARANKQSAEEEQLAITPDMLRMIGRDDDEDREGSDDGEDDDDDDDEDDDDSNAEMSSSEEVDSEMGDGSVAGADDSDADDADAAGIDSEEEAETAHRFADDLFGDEDDEEAANAGGSSSSSSKLSAHERRLAQLQEEISRLETENVSAKDWTLGGEASSRARPKDSLLEQDLDFEQSSKPTPTVTVESTEALEDLIKRRILENRFDDVVTRRVFAQPEYKAEFELSDRKSGRSLAEEYEDVYTRSSDGDGAPRKGENEERLDKEREAIGTLMDDLFDKLDALSNAHFTPKAPKATITTLTSAPSLSVETGASNPAAGSSSSSQLAPQEVYSGDGSVYTGDRSELTPEEKQKLFQKSKKQRKHERLNKEQNARERQMNQSAGKKVAAAAGAGAAPAGGERKEKEEALKMLLGNKGVSVVGKGGGAGKRDEKARGSAAKEGESNQRGEKFKL